MAGICIDKGAKIMNETEARQRLETIFPNKDIQIKYRLLGGMSNYTFVVIIDNELFTYRKPGEYAEYFVDRDMERKNISIMEQLKITNETVYFDVKSGEKIAKYVDGISLHQALEYPLEKVVALLKKIHNSTIRAENDYEPFKRLAKYERHVEKLGFYPPIAYLEIKKKFLDYKPYLCTQNRVLCHGDSQPSNFILSKEEVRAVDFEFCGNNDPIYDIACFANINLDDGLKLLNTYFSDVTPDHLKRFYLWRTFQCFQWYNVATFKELMGMSTTLKIDFNRVAENYLNKIYILLDKVENI
jgi:thiamine kinase-like enzyme